MKSIVTFFSIYILLTACGKKDDIKANNRSNLFNQSFFNGIYFPSDTIRLSTGLYPYLYDTGSYWIYADSLNQINDTVKLTGVWKSFGTLPPPGPNYQGRIRYVEFFRFMYSASDSVGFAETMFLEYITLNSYCCSDANIIYYTLPDANVTYIDSMTVNNILYFNVRKVKNITPLFKVMYFVEGLGVIRKEVWRNDTLINSLNLSDSDVHLFNYY